MNQSYPTVYAEDLKEIESEMGKGVSLWETVGKKEVEETKNLWEMTFDQPYEKAGGEIGFNFNGVFRSSLRFTGKYQIRMSYKYKSMLPRFLLEVSLL